MFHYTIYSSYIALTSVRILKLSFGEENKSFLDIVTPTCPYLSLKVDIVA